MPLLSRRAFLHILSGAVCARAAERLDWNPPGPPRSSAQRRYRADAQVLIFGLPLFHREGIGGGGVSWREFESARLLEFNGFSTPERAAGLNRLGFIREMARTPEGRDPESIYFGLMTASKEETVEQARRALHSAAKEQTYSVIDGRIAVGKAEAATAHFTAPASLSGAQRAELMDRAAQALASAQRIAADGITPDCAQSFLQALAGLLLRPDGREARYSYAGRLYRLRLSRTPDPKATAYFRARRIVPPSETVLRVSGRLRPEAGGKETEFRLWISSAARPPLPLRIDYQAKSYLRLTFEAI